MLVLPCVQVNKLLQPSESVKLGQLLTESMWKYQNFKIFWLINSLKNFSSRQTCTWWDILMFSSSISSECHIVSAQLMQDKSRIWNHPALDFVFLTIMLYCLSGDDSRIRSTQRYVRIATLTATVFKIVTNWRQPSCPFNEDPQNMS